MKILHIITGLDGGGAEKTLLKICKLSNSSHNIHSVISLQSNGFLLPDFQNNKIKVLNFNFKKNLFDIFAIIKLFVFIKKYQPNIVMTWLYHADFIGLLLKFYFNNSFKLIWNIRCSDINFNNYSRITKYLFYFLKKYSHIPNKIIFNSHKGKEFHLSNGFKNDAIEIIPNFIDIEYWKFDNKERKIVRNKFMISDNTFLIGNIGRYDPQKDHKTFINSAKLLIKKKFDIKFLIIGKNTQNIEIPEEFKDYFLILDYQNNIKEYYSAIDLLVLSSSYGEGFSNVILESMAMSVPCIVSDVGDNKKIIAYDEYVFTKGDYVGLYRIINNFIKLNDHRKNQIKEKNRKNIEENYDTKNILIKFNQLWN